MQSSMETESIPASRYICTIHMGMVLAGYEVLIRVKGTASLMGTVLVKGVRAVI